MWKINEVSQDLPAVTQQTFTCSKLTIETLKIGCKVCSKLTIKTFWCFHC